MLELLVPVVLSLVVGALLGFFIKNKMLQNEVSKSGNEADEIIKNAHQEAGKVIDEAKRKAKQRTQQAAAEAKRQNDVIKNKSKQQERHFSEERFKIKQLISEQKDLEKLNSKKENQLKSYETKLSEREKELESIIQEEVKKLEKISELNKEEAKKIIFNSFERQIKKDSYEYLTRTKEQAMENADREAKRLISMAIQRLAAEHTSDSTVSVVTLPNERMRGAIIGREGRNIKAFEEYTGVNIVFDDIPENIALSCFNPVKREIAKIAIKSLIQKNNFSPRNIEIAVKKATKNVEDSVRKAADDTLKHLGIRNVSKEIRENLGKLKYRTSYGQNVLIHSIEVATLAGKMAAEMGYDPILAKRAGLLHDIGKAATGDSEGSHITLGADIAERAKEHPIVINCIFAHHDEAEPIHPISVLVTAADKISSSRPGARRDSVESYAQRIENLEKIAEHFQGIRNVYAINAGREIRVIADANQINDLEANILSEDIADKIREELRFAGQIKVTVIREKKAVQLTDDPKNYYNNYRNKTFEKAIAS